MMQPAHPQLIGLPVLETERLTLRAPQASDWPTFRDYRLIDPANPRSVALAKRLGATPEREAVFFDKTINVWRHPRPEALQ